MWTKDPPTKPGWYWWRRGNGEPDDIAYPVGVICQCGILCAVLRWETKAMEVVGGEWWDESIPPPPVENPTGIYRTEYDPKDTAGDVLIHGGE